MNKKNKIIWLCTLEFLSRFHPIKYDQVPLVLPLLRDFQKYIKRHYKKAYHWKKNSPLKKAVHTACEPYLINEQPVVKKERKLLVRAQLFPLTKHFKNSQCIYIAHHKKEYQEARTHKECRPLLYLPRIPETIIAGTAEKKIQNQLKKIFRSRNTPRFFRTKAFTTWMWKNTRNLLMKIRKVHTLFKKYSFSGVLYGSTINRHGALVTTFAQTRKIKTVNLQHGLLGEIGHLPVNAHLNFVWGKSHQDYLLAFGAPKQKIKMVPPVFIRNNSLGLSDFTDKRSVPPAPPLKVLVALQPLGAQHNHTMIRRIENAAKRYPGKVLVSYKLHPDQSRKLYQKQIRSSSSKLLSHSGNSLHNLMKWCDIIITPYSTVAYEGLLCKKAVVFYGRPQPFYYLKGCATFVKTEEDIKKLFLQLIKHPTFLSTLINQLSLKDNIKNHSYAPLAIENYL